MGVKEQGGLGEIFVRLILSENTTNLQLRLLLPPSVEPVETNGGMGCHHKVVGRMPILGFDKAQGKTLFSLRMGLRIGYCLCKVGE